jgi:hypothetical protein
MSLLNDAKALRRKNAPMHYTHEDFELVMAYMRNEVTMSQVMKVHGWRPVGASTRFYVYCTQVMKQFVMSRLLEENHESR